MISKAPGRGVAAWQLPSRTYKRPHPSFGPRGSKGDIYEPNWSVGDALALSRSRGLHIPRFHYGLEMNRVSYSELFSATACSKPLVQRLRIRKAIECFLNTAIFNRVSRERDLPRLLTKRSDLSLAGLASVRPGERRSRAL